MCIHLYTYIYIYIYTHAYIHIYIHDVHLDRVVRLPRGDVDVRVVALIPVDEREVAGQGRALHALARGLARVGLVDGVACNMILTLWYVTI